MAQAQYANKNFNIYKYIIMDEANIKKHANHKRFPYEIVLNKDTYKGLSKEVKLYNNGLVKEIFYYGEVSIVNDVHQFSEPIAKEEYWWTFDSADTKIIHCNKKLFFYLEDGSLFTGEYKSIPKPYIGADSFNELRKRNTNVISEVKDLVLKNTVGTMMAQGSTYQEALAAAIGLLTHLSTSVELFKESGSSVLKDAITAIDTATDFVFLANQVNGVTIKQLAIDRLTYDKTEGKEV